MTAIQYSKIGQMLLAMLLALASPAVLSAGQWTGPGSVLEVRNAIDGDILVQTDAQFIQGGCTQSSSGLYRMEATESPVDQSLGLLMYAHAIGHEVDVYIDGCVGSNPKFKMLRVLEP